MEAGKGVATAEERRAVVAMLLDAAGAVNGGADVGGTVRTLLERIRTLRPAQATQAAQEQPSTSTALAVIPKPESAPLELREVPSSEKAKAEKAAVLDVFSHWIRATDRGATSKLTNDRIAKIRARLREGYSVDDMKRAIDGCAGSSHHQGQNESGTRYDDLTLILRTGAKLEWFRDMAPEMETPKIEEKKVDPAKVREDREIQELRERANEMLAKNDTKGYTDAIRALKQRTSNAR